MRRLLVTAVVAVGLFAPAAGAEESTTPCSFEVDVTLSPGLSRSPSTGTFDSRGESGTVECRGTVGGEPVKGPGTFGAVGRYGTAGDGDDCWSRRGTGNGTVHLTIPVEDGDRHVDDTVTVTYRVRGRAVVGEIIGERFEGSFDVTKADGDCLRTPIRKIRLKGSGLLR